MLKNLALSALVTLSLCACSTLPSTPPTVTSPPPQSCLTQCDPAPKPADGSELSLRNWEYMLVDLYGQCRRLHADCLAWIAR